jgi:plasmid stabilization system protein ParE
MSVADYGRASPEEREQVIEVLERNLKRLLRHPKVHNQDRLRELADAYIRRIREGEVIKGRDFDILVSLLRGRVPPGV